jgi:sigma-E factor negative regulatory protein RseC
MCGLQEDDTMTQNAVVTKLISRHVAEVEVERGTACGGTCESCEACVFQSRIRAEALNKVSALPGQKVVIESKTSAVLGAAALLYLIPFVLLFLGYAIGSAIGWGEAGCVLIGFAFFALGVAFNVVYQRRKKASPITFEIIQVLET